MHALLLGPNITDVAYSPQLGLYALVTNNSAIFTSPDGVTWTQIEYTNSMMNRGSTFVDIIWANVRRSWCFWHISHINRWCHVDHS